MWRTYILKRIRRKPPRAQRKQCYSSCCNSGCLLLKPNSSGSVNYLIQERTVVVDTLSDALRRSHASTSERTLWPGPLDYGNHLLVQAANNSTRDGCGHASGDGLHRRRDGEGSDRCGGGGSGGNVRVGTGDSIGGSGNESRTGTTNPETLAAIKLVLFSTENISE